MLKHKENGKVRFVLRQEKTMKVVCNFYVVSYDPYCNLKPKAGSDKTWVFTAQDYSDDAPKFDQFALKLPNSELAMAFKDAFEKAKVLNSKVKEFAKFAVPGLSAALPRMPTGWRTAGKGERACCVPPSTARCAAVCAQKEMGEAHAAAVACARHGRLTSSQVACVWLLR